MIAYVFPTVPWKFLIPTIYSFAVNYPWNLIPFLKVASFLTVSIVFSVYKQNFFQFVFAQVSFNDIWINYACKRNFLQVTKWLDNAYSVVRETRRQ